MYSTFIVKNLLLVLWQKLELINSFLAHGELSGLLGNQDVRHKQWKVCNQFSIISSSADTFMHSLKLMVIKNVLNHNTERCITLHLQPLYRLDNLLYHLPDTVSLNIYSTSLPQDTFDQHNDITV